MINDPRRKSTILAITATFMLLSALFGLIWGSQHNNATLTFAEFKHIVNWSPNRKRIKSVITSPGGPVEVHLTDDSIKLLDASDDNKVQAIELLNERDIPICVRGRAF